MGLSLHEKAIVDFPDPQKFMFCFTRESERVHVGFLGSPCLEYVVKGLHKSNLRGCF